MKIIRALLLVVLFSSLTVLRIILPRKQTPDTFIFSMSQEQIFDRGSVKPFLDFLSEKRFSLDFHPEETLIELKHFKALFGKSGGIITLDIVFRMLATCLTRDLFVKIVRQSFYESWHSKYRNGFSLRGFHQFKKQTIDKSFWHNYLKESEKKLIFITTISSIESPPVAFLAANPNLHNCQRIMFWYSTNIKPIETGLGHSRIKPNYTHLNSWVDKHFIWNEDQEKYLSDKGLDNLYVVGSVLFRPRNVATKSPAVFDILFFDVTPLENANTFYTYTTCVNTMNDLLQVVCELESALGKTVEIHIKPKRKYSKFHSERYVNFLSKLAKEGKIGIVNTNENLYEIISKAKYVIGVPFTSPVIVAKELGVPCVFYTGDFGEGDIGSLENGVLVITGRDDLRKEINSNANCF